MYQTHHIRLLDQQYFALVIIYLWNLKLKYDYFKQLGIPGPVPDFFFGHYRILWFVHSVSLQLQKWTQTYGSIYGIFEGTRPIYVVSDVEFLDEVYIKQFSAFHSRHLPLTVLLQKKQDLNLFASSGHQWRRQRRVINPTFSSMKLKLMTPLMNQCLQSLMNKLKQLENEKEEFNICTLYKRLTMDIICRCAFGLDTNLQEDVNNEYIQKGELLFADNTEKHWKVRISKLFPWLTPLLKYIALTEIILQILAHKFVKSVKENPRFWFLTHVTDIIKTRIDLHETNPRVDLLQLMINSTTKESINDNVDEEHLAHHIRQSELISNVFLFLAAGYETTATALSYCTYVLATKPEFQKKIRSVIDAHEIHEDKSDEKINRMDYLDVFVREVLRMYPIGTTAMSRVCSKDTTICGYSVEKGSIIQPDIFSLHYSKDLWGPDDPYEFIPERHLTERHRMAFFSFGQGPRNCIGMRFALMEIKLCLIDLLRQYEIVPGEHIKEKFELQEVHVVRQPKAVLVKIQKRS
ncbi:hypothetical protein I4U23_003491 [Adineta vaga]|nr:hypothetical protein I4U23_003491 [Adineta vaga]